MQSPPNKMKFIIVGQFSQNLTMSMQRLNHFHGFLPEYEPYLSPASPIRRGPMYSAYAELREWRLRTKAAMIKPPPPPPTSLHVGLRKEEKPMAKLPSNVAKMDIPGMTPRPGSKADMRRLGSMMAMKKSMSSLKDMKEMNKDFPHAFMASSFDGGVYKEDKVLMNKVMLKRSVASFKGHAFYNDYNNKMGKLKS